MTHELATEARSERTSDIDLVSVEQGLRLLNDDALTAHAAVDAVLFDLAEVVDTAVMLLARGGRMHYFGAGTSGRIAHMDAAELPPTFGIASDVVVAHMAGGEAALARSVEGAEDDVEAGAQAAAACTSADVAIGLSATGTTPFVKSALAGARSQGATTVMITSNAVPRDPSVADFQLVLDTGPEAITGSTRLKAATAQKLALNALSTMVMVRLGRTYSNLMVGLIPANEKLRRRIVRLLAHASDRADAECEAALEACDYDGRATLVVLRAGVSPEEAAAALEEHRSVRLAVAALAGGGDSLVRRA